MDVRSNLETILSAGTPLGRFGVTGWGANKGLALKAIRSLRGADISIVGGDVVYIQDDKLMYPYDNWYCDQGDAEANPDYALRCFDEALKYVESYSRVLPTEPLFVLVAAPFAG